MIVVRLFPLIHALPAKHIHLDSHLKSVFKLIVMATFIQEQTGDPNASNMHGVPPSEAASFMVEKFLQSDTNFLQYHELLKCSPGLSPIKCLIYMLSTDWMIE